MAPFPHLVNYARMASKKTRHHRKPTSIGGTDDDRNLSWVKDNKHRAWHLLFSNMTAQEIAHEINTRWIDPDWALVPQLRHEKDSRRR